MNKLLEELRVAAEHKAAAEVKAGQLEEDWNQAVEDSVDADVAYFTRQRSFLDTLKRQVAQGIYDELIAQMEFNKLTISKQWVTATSSEGSDLNKTTPDWVSDLVTQAFQRMDK